MAFPRGRFTVHALVGTRDGDQRCAAPWIRFTDEPIARLEVAFEENTPHIAERRCELPSIGVDSGTVALGSPEALAAAPATPEDLAPGPADGSNPYLSGRPQDLWRVVGSGPGPRFITVLSGLGDGGYPALIARDAGGRIVAFIIDFLVGEEEEIREADGGARRS